jgi:predicted transcriptional regulator
MTTEIEKVAPAIVSVDTTIAPAAEPKVIFVVEKGLYKDMVTLLTSADSASEKIEKLEEVFSSYLQNAGISNQELKSLLQEIIDTQPTEAVVEISSAITAEDYGNNSSVFVPLLSQYTKDLDGNVEIASWDAQIVFSIAWSMPSTQSIVHTDDEQRGLLMVEHAQVITQLILLAMCGIVGKNGYEVPAYKSDAEVTESEIAELIAEASEAVYSTPARVELPIDEEDLPVEIVDTYNNPSEVITESVNLPIVVLEEQLAVAEAALSAAEEAVLSAAQVVAAAEATEEAAKAEILLAEKDVEEIYVKIDAVENPVQSARAELDFQQHLS